MSFQPCFLGRPPVVVNYQAPATGVPQGVVYPVHPALGFVVQRPVLVRVHTQALPVMRDGGLGQASSQLQRGVTLVGGRLTAAEQVLATPPQPVCQSGVREFTAAVAEWTEDEKDAYSLMGYEVL